MDARHRRAPVPASPAVTSTKAATASVSRLRFRWVRASTPRECLRFGPHRVPACVSWVRAGSIDRSFDGKRSGPRCGPRAPGVRGVPPRSARGGGDAARERTTATGCAHGRRQEPHLPAPGEPAARDLARHLSAGRADERPGPGPRRARRTGHVPGRDTRSRRAAASHGPTGSRRLQAGVRRPGTPGLPGIPRRARSAPGPAAGHRRSALHQRMGTRLPTGVHGRSATWSSSSSRRSCSPARPPPRPSCATRSWRDSAWGPTRRNSSAASPAPTSPCVPSRSARSANGMRTSMRCSRRRSASRARLAAPPSSMP